MVLVALGKLSWMRWRWLVTLGALTYPLYLLHMQLARVTVTRLHDAVPRELLMVLVLAAVLLLAHLVHRLVKRPAAKLLHRQLKGGFAHIHAADAAAAAR